MKPKDNLLYTIESYFEYNEVLDMYAINFYSTFMMINDNRIFYTKLFTIENQIMDIPLFQFFKNVSENTEIIDLTHIIGTAILHFGGHYFLIYLSNSKLLLFFPHDKNKILLEQFDDFKFYVKDGNILIPLENNSDLGNSRTQAYIRARVLKMTLESLSMEARRGEVIMENEQEVTEKENLESNMCENRPISICDDILKNKIEIPLYPK
ncbi:hypothetical protein NAPIS_ORF00915 [Vairimorpha apis BRL 01]|uniref:Uncharacterized protein n=1 Tax=Vairimorpha apis BRL 01 TaxID=1037528 RepID=T0MEJ4_9MICR|nr:hypothetical protein NAPIS_ORF00915 [Vairimorpha apis BRL 01]